ncbi:MAG: DUF3181 family protein [Synechococcus sp.]|uniref:DUF3181 family protein n=1 Tax=Synechococcus sp. BMK-MC-1 TaxID=1442551 RepID=UPI00164887DA|nr:DUF3181 family protein [Synechococcus sp. BMK-MC-1]QNI66521.1 hypothetical protein SynBMKMC1_00412 [Synechococcus sp. BMK-MC-1]
MTMDAADLHDLTSALGDRLYLQVSGWHLYLKDAGLAEALAIECSALLDQGAEIAARQALERVQVSIGGGSSRLPLARLLPSSQLSDLEQILEDHCR